MKRLKYAPACDILVYMSGRDLTKKYSTKRVCFIGGTLFCVYGVAADEKML